VSLVDRSSSRSERNDPAVDLDALLAAGGIMRGVDHSLQRVEVGRTQAGEVRLAHPGWIADIGAPTHLHHHHVAVGLSNISLLRSAAYNSQQLVHLRLVEEAGSPRVNPPCSVLIGRSRRCSGQAER